MATNAAEGTPETLKYQTWTLKVPIHCRGCARKVKRVLHAIDGVFTTNVDGQLHKVTVTGDVDAEALVKKLVRSGKQAELWPEKKPGKSKKNGGESNKESKDGVHGEAAATDKDGKSETPVENNGSADDSKDSDDEGNNSSPESDEKASEAKPVANGSDGGKKKKKKKKKKKGQNANADASKEASSDSAQPQVAGPDLVPIVSASSNNICLPDPPTDVAFTPPLAHYAMPVMCGFGGSSLNHSSGTSCYYTSLMPHSFLYAYQQVGMYPPPDPIITYGDGNDDSYYDDDDEVGCSIM